MVHRTLGLLLETGIIELVGQGRNVAYRLSLTHPFRSALTGLFDTELRRVEALWAAITTAATTESEPAKAVWLYGSVARGEDGINSDCDIALVYPDDAVVEEALSWVRVALQPVEAEAQVTLSFIGLSYADVRRLGGSGDPLWKNLVRDSVALSGPSPDSLLATLRVTEKLRPPA
jgi:predicted nucleotidyltransferase